MTTGTAADAGMPVASRIDGHAPIRDYAVIGDGRTVALVARNGAIDWHRLPDMDQASVFGALLDVRRAGAFRLAPEIPFSVARRYVPNSNVLEATFFTDEGTVKVTDALTLTGDGLAPARELARRVEPLSGIVPMQWSLKPRFGCAAARTRFSARLGVPVASAGADAIAVCAWEAGDARCETDAITP